MDLKSGLIWHEIFKKETGMQVYDPDGWRNDDLDMDTHICDYDEFKKRAVRSSLIPIEN